MSEDNLNSIDSLEDADALLESIDRPDNSPIQDTQPSQTQSTPVEDSWEITVGGKPVKASREQLIQWAQQGYTAPGRISQLSKDLERYKSEETKWAEMQNKYGEVDSYVRQNPQFWEHVMQSYQQRNQVLNDQSNPLAQTVQSLQSRIEEQSQTLAQIMQERQKMTEQQQDQAYLQTFEELKKSYPDVDFETPNAEGMTLEYRVLKHAQENGINNFKTAFRDYYHDELMSRTEAKAKEEAIKQQQKTKKAGILGITTTPQKGRPSGNIKDMSYDDLMKEALEELGIN